MPEALQRELLEAGYGQDSAAMAEYRRRFVCARSDASCLTAPEAGASVVVQRALCGSSPFQVMSRHAAGVALHDVMLR